MIANDEDVYPRCAVSSHWDVNWSSQVSLALGGLEESKVTGSVAMQEMRRSLSFLILTLAVYRMLCRWSGK